MLPRKITVLDTLITDTTAILVDDDVAVAHEGLTRLFRLTAGTIHRDDSGRAVHAEVRAGDQVIWLHPSAVDYRSPRHPQTTHKQTACTRLRPASGLLVDLPP